MIVRSPRYSRSVLQRTEIAGASEIAHAIFYPPGPDWAYSPEAMARLTRDGAPEIYVGGLNDEILTLHELAEQTKRSEEDDGCTGG